MLEYLEEVLAFKVAILWQISAMDCISDTVDAELSSNSFGSEMLGNFWITRSNHLSECLDNVLLADFQNYGRSRNEMLNLRVILRENIFVDIIELLNSWFVEIEHFNGGNLKAFV